MPQALYCRTDTELSVELVYITQYGSTVYIGMAITQYGSTVYIGMAMGGSAL